MKRILSLFLVIIVMSSIVVPASAAVKDEAELYYTHINTVSAGLSINTTWGIATCSGSVAAKQIVPVKVVVRLQMYKDGDWENVKTWSETGTAGITISNDYAIYSGYKYRVYTTGYVYDSKGVLQEAASAIQTVNYPSP